MQSTEDPYVRATIKRQTVKLYDTCNRLLAFKVRVGLWMTYAENRKAGAGRLDWNNYFLGKFSPTRKIQKSIFVFPRHGRCVKGDILGLAFVRN